MIFQDVFGGFVISCYFMLFHVIACSMVMYLFDIDLNLDMRDNTQASGESIQSQPFFQRRPSGLQKLNPLGRKIWKDFGGQADKPWIFHRIFPISWTSNHPPTPSHDSPWPSDKGSRTCVSWAICPEVQQLQSQNWTVAKKNWLKRRNLETWFPKSFLISDQSGTNRTSSIGKHFFDSWPHWPD